MLLNKGYRYFILCEDKQTQCFIKYFLMRHGIDIHKMTFCGLPQSGCGEQHVREKYPEELSKLRSANYNKICLIVAIDADTKTVENRYHLLDSMCRDAGIAVRNSNDLVMYVVPKRNIETWIAYYDEREYVNEDTDYGHNRGNESKCKPMAGKMAMQFMTGTDLSDSLLSIRSAKYEYDHVAGKMV